MYNLRKKFSLMCFVLWLLFFGGRCGHLLLLLSSIICFSSAEGMVSSSSEHILGCQASDGCFSHLAAFPASSRDDMSLTRSSQRLTLSNYPTIQVVQLYKPRTRYVTHPIQPIRRLISALSLAPFIIISISTTDGDVYLADSAHVPQVHV